MNHEWLRSFTVFAERLNFTHAAKELHLTQPAVHVQVAKLSEQVGVTLYLRKGRNLLLTKEGQRLAAYGRDVLERDQRFLSELRGESCDGPVALASGHGSFRYLLGPTIRRFPRDRWPLRLLTMTGPQVVEAVQDATANVGVAVVDNDLPPGVTRIPLRAVGQQVLVPRGHRLARRKTVKPVELDGEPMVVAPAGSPHRTMLANAMAACNASLAVAVEATGWELMMQFALCGLGITVVNDFCTVPRGLVSIPLRQVPPVSYSLLTRTGSSSKGQTRLVRLLCETTSSQTPGGSSAT